MLLPPVVTVAFTKLPAQFAPSAPQAPCHDLGDIILPPLIVGPTFLAVTWWNVPHWTIHSHIIVSPGIFFCCGSFFCSRFVPTFPTWPNPNSPSIRRPLGRGSHPRASRPRASGPLHLVRSGQQTEGQTETKVLANRKYMQKQKCTCDGVRTDGKMKNLKVRSGPGKDGRTDKECKCVPKDRAESESQKTDK